ncbi:MAG: cysteine protease StiP family protein [Lachnospiraceae bacterium]|nr:cysteine protease StiP family protein [Lachnospiraceae bacterium]
MNLVKSSYKKEDVTILLKDITGMVLPQPTQERERLIQSGVHYCEMLPIEYKPSAKYMEAYQEALKHYAKPTAKAVAALAGKVAAKYGDKVVLVSLARAGIPIGILLKRFLQTAFHIQAPHYAISIIRGRGIDDNAMHYILERHCAEHLLFVDGWIGKGAILGELKKCLAAYKGVSPELAVAADPAYITELCGTHQDILIPSSCLNSTVSGLISRTFLRSDIIGTQDFHGAAYYGELADADLSYAFIHAIEAQFPTKEESNGNESNGNELNSKESNGNELNSKESNGNEPNGNESNSNKLNPDELNVPIDKGIDEVRKIAAQFDIEDINFIKPGIGETTRVLLRRVPWKVLIQQESKSDEALNHIYRLAEEKGVPVAYYPLQHYKACGIIKKIADA